MSISVVFIEFDLKQYPTVVDCSRWIRDNVELKHLFQIKGFALRKCKSYQMSLAEPRSVFAFYGEWARYKKIETARPECGILVGIRSGGETYTETDMPALSEKALEKKRKMDLKLAERDRKMLNKDADQKQRRRRRELLSKAVNEDEETQTETKKRNKRKREVIKKERSKREKSRKKPEKEKKSTGRSFVDLSSGSDLLTDSDAEEELTVKASKVFTKLADDLISSEPILKTVEVPDGDNSVFNNSK